MLSLRRILEDLMNRVDMPQISGAKINDAVAALKATGVKVTMETILPSKLHDSQKQVYQDKVDGIAQSIKNGKVPTPVVISSDNHTVDGHHRALAQDQLNPKKKIKVIRIHLPMKQAIQLYKEVQQRLAEA